MKLDFLVLMYLSIFPQYIYSCTYQLMNIRLRLRNFYTFYNSCTFLKFMTMLKNFSLCDICVIDYPQNTNRFLFIYNLWSYRYNIRLFLTTFQGFGSSMSSSSLSTLYSSSTWIEREIWDMFGLKFQMHLDLRRILTDYGFFGYPLRKDFPLSGYFELYYSDLKNSIVYSNLELNQDFRLFFLSNPWENIQFTYSSRVEL